MNNKQGLFMTSFPHLSPKVEARFKLEFSLLFDKATLERYCSEAGALEIPRANIKIVCKPHTRTHTHTHAHARAHKK